MSDGYWMEDGRWKMGAGRWMLEDGRLMLEDGRWRLDVRGKKPEAKDTMLDAGLI
ncbi:phosphotransferase [Chryseobacterium sp. VAUSW3]|uniref:phosphotransferase n=1 Tax=Chryseobacterium sp. VAUSW3 TaxID=2010998 RepID=UPI0015C6A92B|nr:phosphotransferase [Chryseobacterium sp. VAUSW3]